MAASDNNGSIEVATMIQQAFAVNHAMTEASRRDDLPVAESQFPLTVPKHHLPSARELTFTPKSSIFDIVDYSNFMILLPNDIHRIARDRHIVVQNVPQKEFSWSRETVSYGMPE